MQRSRMINTDPRERRPSEFNHYAMNNRIRNNYRFSVLSQAKPIAFWVVVVLVIITIWTQYQIISAMNIEIRQLQQQIQQYDGKTCGLSYTSNGSLVHLHSQVKYMTDLNGHKTYITVCN